jgi:hypothetical protein
MNEQKRRRLIIGATLIVLGVGLFALQFVEGLSDAVILLLIGGVFMAGYLYARAYGLLIPGCLLLGLGLGVVGANTFDFEIGPGTEVTMSGEDTFELLGLGVGFVAIYVIPLVYQGRSHWWPLIPGLILILFGLAVESESFERLFEFGWPLVLTFIGLLLLAGAVGLTGRKRGG